MLKFTIITITGLWPQYISSSKIALMKYIFVCYIFLLISCAGISHALNKNSILLNGITQFEFVPRYHAKDNDVSRKKKIEKSEISNSIAEYLR